MGITRGMRVALVVVTAMTVICGVARAKGAPAKDSATVIDIDPKWKPVPDVLAFDPNVQPRKPGFSRPEERGEVFSKLAAGELVKRLTTSKDKIVQRKAAIALGDRALKTNVALDAKQRQALDAYVVRQVDVTTTQRGQTAEEARHQILRLWYLAARPLLASLGHTKDSGAETVMKSLIKMRTEPIIKAVIATVETTKDPRTKMIGLVTLGMMRERSYTILRNRPIMGVKQTDALAAKLIRPFLNRLQKTETNKETKLYIKAALKFLDKPRDARPTRVTGKGR